MEENKCKNKSEIYLNYKRCNKWLGIIDYKSLIVIISYIFMVIIILKIIPLKFEYLTYIFIILVIPVVSLIAINASDDSAVDTLIQILKYCINNKIYVKKENIKKLDKRLYKKADKKLYKV